MKYDFDLDLENRNSLSIIVDRVEPDSTILEFGPAHGRISKYLKEKLNCKIYAVELDSIAARDAEQFCEQIIVEDIEKYTWINEYQKQRFDYIVFSDVLEHLHDPKKVLNEAKQLLTENGSILISIPNIAHNSILIDLLNDQFIYRDTGLLDSTHIKFFTKNTFEQLIKECELEIQYESGVYVSPCDTEFHNDYNEIDVSLSKVLQNRKFGEVYQFVFELKNKVESTTLEFIKEEHAYLYLDTGSDFNETEKEKISFSFEEDKQVSFVLENTIKNVKSIRIDLFNKPFAIKIRDITVNAVDVTDKMSHNGVPVMNSEIKFLDNKPLIIVNFETAVELKNVTINYDYVSIITNVLEQKIQLLQQQIDAPGFKYIFRSLINRFKKMLF